MKRTLRTSILALSAVLILAVAGPLQAEIVTDATMPNFIILLGITEGPDPIPNVTWDPVLSRPDLDVLNVQGFMRNDGRPDIAVDTSQGFSPLAVWAYDTGNDMQIAFAELGAAGWPANPQFISTSAYDDLDPRIFAADDGTLSVVWWEDGPEERILFSSRPVDGNWEAPEIIADPGRRPSVIMQGQQTLIAYERDASSSGSQEIVVVVKKPASPLSFQVVTEVPSTLPLNIVLHHRADRTWMEWRHGYNQFGYSELIDGSWQAPSTKPWSDRTWLGEEMIRRVIQRDLLTP